MISKTFDVFKTNIYEIIIRINEIKLFFQFLNKIAHARKLDYNKLE